jgi:hypothetical protein
MKTPILVASRALIGLLGFALGVYMLPILIEPIGPSAADIAAQVKSATYTGTLSP